MGGSCEGTQAPPRSWARADPSAATRAPNRPGGGRARVRGAAAPPCRPLRRQATRSPACLVRGRAVPAARSPSRCTYGRGWVGSAGRPARPVNASVTHGEGGWGAGSGGGGHRLACSPPPRMVRMKSWGLWRGRHWLCSPLPASPECRARVRGGERTTCTHKSVRTGHSTDQVDRWRVASACRRGFLQVPASSASPISCPVGLPLRKEPPVAALFVCTLRLGRRH